MMMHREWKQALPACQLVLGLVLLFAPLLFGHAAEETATLTAGLTGGVIALVAVGGLTGRGVAAGWVNLILGAWAVIAPWALEFAGIESAVWSHVVLGGLVALAAAVELWLEQHQAPPGLHA